VSDRVTHLGLRGREVSMGTHSLTHSLTLPSFSLGVRD
jgi:hypothetical protein